MSEEVIRFAHLILGTPKSRSGPLRVHTIDLAIYPIIEEIGPIQVAHLLLVYYRIQCCFCQSLG